MELREYQKEAFCAIIGEWKNGNLQTLLVLPTGCGKTIVFAKIAEYCVHYGKRVLILAHREELLTQADDKINKVTGLSCAYEKAELTSVGSELMLTVASVQTLAREKRLLQFERDYFDVIIVDEAHHAVADSYQYILKYFSGANVLGVTATPDRGDMRGLNEYFKSLAYEYTLPQAIKDGYLCPITVQTIPLKMDLSGVKIGAGDFMPSDLDEMLDEYLEKIADEMAKICKSRKTVVFLPLIKTSQRFTEILNLRGFSATEINCKTENRCEIISDFENGKYNVLCNSLLLTEGWDCPQVDCIVILRPTKIRSLYSQMVGRGTRLCKGKTDLLLLDFLWHVTRHRLCKPASLLSENEEIENKINAILENSETAVGLEEAEETAIKEIENEREANLARTLQNLKHNERKIIDPIQFELSIHSNIVINYVPVFKWEMDAPTEKQIKLLQDMSMSTDGIDTKGKARKLIDILISRQKAGYASLRQIKFLESKDFRNVGMWSFKNANDMIAAISANNWKIPQGIDPISYAPQCTTGSTK